MNDFLIGLLGNVLVGLAFLALAWWKTDAIAARLEERRRLQAWETLGPHTTSVLLRTLLFISVNVANLGGWSAPVVRKGFNSISPGAWAAVLESFLARVASEEPLKRYTMKNEFESLVVGSIPRTRVVVARALKQLDRVADRYSQAVPSDIMVDLLATVSAMEVFLDQLQTWDGQTSEEQVERVLVTNARVAAKLYRALERLSITMKAYPNPHAVEPPRLLLKSS
jgi:hypothetical protein